MKTYSIIIKDYQTDSIIKLNLIKCDNIKKALKRVCDNKFNHITNFIGSDLKTYNGIDSIDEKEVYLTFNTMSYNDLLNNFSNSKVIDISLLSKPPCIFRFEIKEITFEILSRLKNNYDILVKDKDLFELVLVHLYELEYI